MSLISCAACHKTVAADAEKCPHCGYDTRSKRVPRWKNLLILQPLSLLLAFLMGYGSMLALHAGGSTKSTAFGLAILIGMVAHWVVHFIGWEIIGKRNII